ncbi:amidohydrolase [Candidatus Formimonas warabiya]|uniref:Amidohydrolase n=1 Tax=Formimonas warabiya TaxID=1761012 RepID=A0A3G1KTC8_FORW1|nr:amidohydrolase [Candidatus Formimonas warabiya]ATW25732.1 amidohydrolase [Candidatus Formimonas warabiya]
MDWHFDKEKWQPYLDDCFHRLHEIPEVSWQEYRTTAWIKDRLKELGYDLITIPNSTGLIGMRGKGPFTVALRADMDALCHSTGAGEQILHSCGHDAHMAMVLTAAGALAPLSLPEGTALKIVFQPAEEQGEGALRLIESGVMDDVDFLFGVHLRPGDELPAGKFSPAVKHGAAQTIYGELTGVPAHGARPYLGINVIEVAMAFLHLLQGLHFTPLTPASVKMTRFMAGSEADNIIPGYGRFTLDLRAGTNEQMEKLTAQVERMASHVSAAYGAEIKLSTVGKTVAAEVNREAEGILCRAIRDSAGPESLASSLATPGAEDFHYYPHLCPRIKAAMMGLGCNVQPGLHHPEMHFEHAYLIHGAEILARAAWYAMERR